MEVWKDDGRAADSGTGFQGMTPGPERIFDIDPKLLVLKNRINSEESGLGEVERHEYAVVAVDDIVFCRSGVGEHPQGTERIARGCSQEISISMDGTGADHVSARDR
eukprot:962974-Rhodomonas_salina.1